MRGSRKFCGGVVPIKGFGLLEVGVRYLFLVTLLIEFNKFELIREVVGTCPLSPSPLDLITRSAYAIIK